MARKHKHRGVVSQALDDIFKDFDLLGDFVDVVFDAIESVTAGVVKVNRRRRRKE
jgi:hypothetical protein